MQKRNGALLIFFVCLLLGACSFRKLKEDDSGTLQPTFSSLEENVFQPKCLHCHTGAGGSGGVDLSTYAGLIASDILTAGDPSSSVLYTDVLNGIMPKSDSPLSSDEVQAIHDWIQAGALDDSSAAASPSPAPSPLASPTPIASPAPTPSPIVVPDQVDYATLTTMLLTPKCLHCHNSDDNEGNVDFTDYAGMLNNPLVAKLVIPGDPDNSVLYQAVKSGDMPRPKSGPRLSSDELLLVYKWIQQGAIQKNP